MSSLTLTPTISDHLVIVADVPKTLAKPPSRFASPETSRAPSPSRFEQRTATAEALHRSALRAKAERAEELGTRRVEHVLNKRSEKEQAAMRALMDRMASAEEKRDSTKKLQLAKFEKARFLRQAAKDAKAKHEESLRTRADALKSKEEQAAAKRARRLAEIAHANSRKYNRAKELGARARCPETAEAAAAALQAKLDAHTALRDDAIEALRTPVKKHNERVRSVVARRSADAAARSLELDASARRRSAEVAEKRSAQLEATAARAAKASAAVRDSVVSKTERDEAARARIVHAMYRRLQAAEAKRLAQQRTPTKQARARAVTREMEAKLLSAEALGFTPLEPAQRELPAALAARLALHKDEGRCREQRLREERRSVGASGRVDVKRSLIVAKAHRASERVSVAAERRALAAAAAAAKIASKSAAAAERIAARDVARSERSALAAQRRTAAVERRATAHEKTLAAGCAADERMRAALARRAAAMAHARARAFVASIHVGAAAARRLRQDAASAERHEACKGRIARAGARRLVALHATKVKATKLADAARFAQVVVGADAITPPRAST